MSHLLNKPKILPLRRLLSSTAAAAAAAADDPIRQASLTGGGERPLRRLLAGGPPLPLPRPHHSHPHHHLHRPHRQAPSLLPLPPPLPPRLPSQLPHLTRFSSSSPDTPTPPPAPSVIRVCHVVDDLSAAPGRNMEAVLDDLDVALDSAAVVAVLDHFRHSHKPALRFFRWAASRPGFAHDSVTYNAMLGVLGKTRQFEVAKALLEEMGELGLLTMESFKIAIKALAAAREKLIWVFQLMKKRGFEGGVETLNSLMTAIASVRLAREAQQVFDIMKDQYKPDLRTYTALLHGWCKAWNLMEARRVWKEMLDSGFEPDILAHNSMLKGLIRGGRRPDAVKIFELMKAKGPIPIASTYTIFIRDLCKAGKMEVAVECLREMLEAGCHSDVATYTSLIVGFGNAGQMDKAYSLLKEMTERGCPPDGRLCNALIKLMTNRRMPDDAVMIYKWMLKDGLETTVHTYNMLMKSYFQGNDYDKGCKEMGRKGMRPDVTSYTVLIAGHIRHGRPEEAYKYMVEMASKGMWAPQINYYNKFAEDFSRIGNPDVLRQLALEMNFCGKLEVSTVFNNWAERTR